jgi:hypothetical protein
MDGSLGRQERQRAAEQGAYPGSKSRLPPGDCCVGKCRKPSGERGAGSNAGRAKKRRQAFGPELSVAAAILGLDLDRI